MGYTQGLILFRSSGTSDEKLHFHWCTGASWAAIRHMNVCRVRCPVALQTSFPRFAASFRGPEHTQPQYAGKTLHHTSDSGMITTEYGVRDSP